MGWTASWFGRDRLAFSLRPIQIPSDPFLDCLWVVGKVGEEETMIQISTRAINSTITANFQP